MTLHPNYAHRFAQRGVYLGALVSYKKPNGATVAGRVGCGRWILFLVDVSGHRHALADPKRVRVYSRPRA